MTSIPRPMPDPCKCCPKSRQCNSNDTYKCGLFRALFISAWDETVAFLKEQIDAISNDRCP